MLGTTIGLLSAGIWVYLLFGRGRFWDVRLPLLDLAEPPDVRIVAVVPARNEAPDVGRTVASLLSQRLHGDLKIILVDDQSEDGTAAEAVHAATVIGAADRLTVLQTPPLPTGWTGKLWALNAGIAHATADAPDYLLLTDADIRHDPFHVDTLVRRATTEHLDLASEMVMLRAESWIERRLIPAFVFFFFMLYPPRWAADPGRSLAAAAGGCILIRPAMLNQIGGIEAIRDRLIDDCALAAAVKRQGGRIRLDVTEAAHSLRRYEHAGSVWDMIARSAYTQLDESPWLLTGAIAGLIVTYLAPAWLTVADQGMARLLGIGSLLAMFVAFAPTLRLYGVNRLWGLALPAIAIFYAAATIGSAVAHWRGAGGAWKGRVRSASGYR